MLPSFCYAAKEPSPGPSVYTKAAFCARTVWWPKAKGPEYRSDCPVSIFFLIFYGAFAMSLPSRGLPFDWCRLFAAGRLARVLVCKDDHDIRVHVHDLQTYMVEKVGKSNLYVCMYVYF